MYFCSFLIGLHVFVFAWPVCRLHSVALGIRNIKCHYDSLASIIIEQLKEVTFYLFVGFFFFISFLSAESLIIIPTDSPCFPWRSVRLTFHASQISSYDSVSPGSGWPAEARTGRSAGEPEAGALRRTHTCNLAKGATSSSSESKSHRSLGAIPERAPGEDDVSDDEEN